MQLLWGVDVGAGDGETGEGGVEEDDGVETKGVERTVLINEVEGA